MLVAWLVALQDKSDAQLSPFRHKNVVQISKQIEIISQCPIETIYFINWWLIIKCAL